MSVDSLERNLWVSLLRVMFFDVPTFDLYSHPLCTVPSEKISPSGVGEACGVRGQE